ncbi:AAA family ATPase [Anaerolinea thermophila]|uniref:Bacterial transcriptional activator domain-containing protein n=1 Tax=Anaerolinea thermophila (strain DSM 14523 / JCM 11388 / NBRC 100420 / UNI-1) TaxID=926569 RepID=E8MYE3_ANATU|nr:AAA family ATPase [Anaerolinea thermophila]BAJ62088.1 hypothetical protein ANT_00540 [Anaerolinea thermophila UNI-1]
MNRPARIHLLGTPAVYFESQPLEIPRREVRTLLYFLACQREPVSRTRLTLLFWGDYPEETARKRLRESLARLKSIFPIRDLIQTPGEEVFLHPQYFFCDALEFENNARTLLTTLASIPLMTPLPELLATQLRRTVTLWSGKCFLADVRLPDSPDLEWWRLSHGDFLLGMQTRLLERMAAHETAQGNVEQAIEWLNRGLEFAPLDEGLNHALLELLERRGWFSQAQSHLEEMTRRFTAEEQPLPSWIEAWRGRLRVSLERTSASVSRGEPPSPLPWVGRKEALDALHRACFRGGVVLIIGEEGAGKTRLVYQCLSQAPAMRRLLSVTASPQDRTLPYHSWVQILRKGVLPQHWQALSKNWLGFFSLLLGELREAFPDLPPPSSETAFLPTMAFEGLERILNVVKQETPLALWFDNVHWCDESSLEALEYLIHQNFFDENALLVLSTIPNPASPTLSRILRDVPLTQTTLIELRGLTRQEVRWLLQKLGNVEPKPELVDRLHRESGGNPLLLQELLRAMVQDGSPSALVTGAGNTLSRRLHALIRRRLEQLTPQARQVLEGAAVLGSEFALPHLLRILSLPEEQAVQGVEELLRAQLLTHAEGSSYRFQHEMVHTVTLLNLSDPYRRLLHRRAAQMLKEQAGNQPRALAGRIADHLEQAGENLPALEYWVEAARYHRRVYAVQQARQAFQHAERMLEQLGMGAPDDLVLTLYEEWCAMAFDLHQFWESQRAAERLLSQGYLRQNARLLASALLEKALAAELQNRAEEMQEYLASAVPYLETVNDDALWLRYAFHQGGIASVVRGEVKDALRVFGKAWVRWRGESDRRLLELHANLGSRYAQALISAGRLEEALQVGEQALEEARRAVSHSAGARILPALALANVYLGRYDLALRQAEMAQAMLRHMDNHRILAVVHSIFAMVMLAKGNLSALWTFLEQMKRETREAQVHTIEAWTQRVWGDTLQLLGAIEESNRVYEQVLLLPVGDIYRAEAVVRLGLGRVLAGQGEAGLSLLEDISQTAQAGGMGLVVRLADAARALALALLGRCEESSTLTERLSAEGHLLDLLTFTFAHLAMCVVALKQNRLLEARMKAMALASRAGEHDVLFMEIYALVVLIHTARRMGEDTALFEAQLHERLNRLVVNARHTPLEDYAGRLQGWIATFLQ